MKICYLGGFDPTYTRNYFNRLALDAVGIDVQLCRVAPAVSTVRKLPLLLRQFLQTSRDCDVIVVAEYNPTLLPFAWVLSKTFAKPLVFDLVISQYLGTVIERQRVAENSFSARKLWWIEKIAGALCDGILTGSLAYKALLIETFRFPAERLHVIPLGIDPDQFRPIEKSVPDSPPLIFYFGSFIPNHGVDVILNAIALLSVEYQLILLGDGEGKAAAQQLAQELGLKNTKFLPRVAFADVPPYIADADILLGVFGNTRQADTAMANKVLQSLAMYKPVVTGATTSNKEHFVSGTHLIETPLGDSPALATALEQLLLDADLRQQLADAGGAQVHATLTPMAVGKRLQIIFQGLLQ